jgi:Family of unknown function (DUF6064)
MPFSADAFFDVFTVYNRALWPFAAALWLLTAGVFALFVSNPRDWASLLRLVLAGHWLWAGAMYHAFFFTAINPVAWLFAALFILQSVLFAAPRSFEPSTPVRRGSMRHVVSTALIVYGLLYPLVAWADGFVYPRMPTFGVPCPTVVLTIGFLIAVSTRSLLLSAVPIAWSLVGGSAAWLFGVHADLALPVAGVILAGDLMLRRSHVMKKLSLVGTSAVLVAMFVLFPTSSVLAQAPQHDHEQQAQKGMKMGEMKMDAKMMDEMAAKKKANTARIATLMAQVKTSTGDAKVAAMADVIAVLVEERAAMQEHCASMMSMMKK